MKNRLGITLTEVLVAIFIMGIGLLSLLALFPLGAVNMAQAIKDQRTTDFAIQSTGFASTKIGNVRNDFLVRSAYVNSDIVNGAGRINNDLRLVGPNANIPRVPMPDPQLGAGLPVYVDPLGVFFGTPTPRAGATSGIPGNAVGIPNNPAGVQRLPLFHIGRTADNIGLPAIAGTNAGIRRTSIGLVNNPGTFTVNLQLYRRWFTNLDDIIYDDNGLAKLSGVSFTRNSRYSCAFLCQQNESTLPTGPDRPVRMSIVIYDNRPWSNPTSSEPAYAAIFNQGSKIGTLMWTANQARPPVDRGSWILDATCTQAPSGSAAGPPTINGYFYRVSSVSVPSAILAVANSMDIELEKPAQASTPYPSVPGAVPAPAANGVAVVMRNVVEVFDRPPQ